MLRLSLSVQPGLVPPDWPVPVEQVVRLRERLSTMCAPESVVVRESESARPFAEVRRVTFPVPSQKVGAARAAE